MSLLRGSRDTKYYMFVLIFGQLKKKLKFMNKYNINAGVKL